MGLGLEAADLPEMGMVNVCIHSEQALEDALNDVHEIRRECRTSIFWEEASVINLQDASLSV
jgi:hypothetical protein